MMKWSAWHGMWRARGVAVLAGGTAGAALIGAGLILLFPVKNQDASRDLTDIPGPSSTVAAGEPTPTLAAGGDANHGALDRAGQMVRDGRFEAAVVEYEAIARAEATDRDVRAAALLGAGVARFESGDLMGAIENLRSATLVAAEGSAVAVRGGYLLGLRLNESALYSEAIRVLEPLAAGAAASPLGPYVVAELARAKAGAGDAEGAAASWDSLLAMKGLNPSLRSAILDARAAEARKAGKTEELAGWLGKLASERGDPATRYELAGVAYRLGDLATFEEELRAIIGGAPGSNQAVFAVADLRAAGFEVGAGEEGLVYYRRGAYAEARRVLTVGVEEPGIGAAERAFRYYYLAAANEDAGEATAALQYYDLAAAQGAASVYTHRAKYWAARVTEGLGELQAASARYVDLATNGPGGEFSAEARFRAGYTLFRAGDAAGAVATWEQLNVDGEARALYWKGRAHRALGDEAGASAAFQAAAEREPLGFYGMESARAVGRQSDGVGYRPLGRVGAPDWGAIEAWLAGIIGGASPVGRLTAAEELSELGLREEAAAAVRDAAKGEGAWRLLALTREAYRAGLLNVAASLAVEVRQAVGVGWEEAPRELMQLAYPVGYVELVDRRAQAEGVDPLWLAAVIRQESFWDASAVSHAGAIGLTQVMPATGTGIAGTLDMEFEPEDLLRPAVSVQFGAYYLGSQLRRFGDPLVALAAYNAGPGNARRWQEGGSGGGADFVERVDIGETQHYVVAVMEHYAHYVRAYRD